MYSWTITSVKYQDFAGFEYDESYANGDISFGNSSGLKIEGEFLWWKQVKENGSTLGEIWGDADPEDLEQLNLFRFDPVDLPNLKPLFLIMPKVQIPKDVHDPFAPLEDWDLQTFGFIQDYDPAYTSESVQSLIAEHLATEVEHKEEYTYDVGNIINSSIRCVEGCRPKEVPEASPLLGLALIALIATTRLLKGKTAA
jgi:hypothetical protein